MTSIQELVKRDLPNFLRDYEVGKEIAAGGAAKVFHCKKSMPSTNIQNENVVCKILCDFLNDRQRRFHEEALFLQRLNHKNIVRIFDYYEDDMVMVLEKAEYSLQDITNTRTFKNPTSAEKFSTRELLLLLQQVCSGVCYLHEHGVVHRDICPANVLIRADGTAVISDLGMSTVGDVRLRDDTLGNPKQYAPPEQSDKLLNAREPADVFSFSMLCYNTITGGVAKGIPTPKLHELSPEVPTEISEILFRALAFDPGERPTIDEINDTMTGFGPHSSSGILARRMMSHTSRFSTPFAEFFGPGEIIDDTHYQTEIEIIQTDYQKSLEFFGIAFQNLNLQLIAQKTKHLGNAKFLLPNLNNDEQLDQLSEVLGKSQTSISDDIDASIQNILECREDNESIEVRLSHIIPPWRMILLDDRLLLKRLYGGDRERNHLFKAADGRYRRRMSTFFYSIWNNHSEEIS